MASSTSPTLAAAPPATASTFPRTPHSGFCERRLASKSRCSARYAGRPGGTGRREQEPCRRQDPRSAVQQRLGRRPGRDMDHVDADDGVGAIRPARARAARRAPAVAPRWANPGVLDPRGDAFARVGSASLGCHCSAGCAAAKCTACCPVPAGDLEDGPGRRHCRPPSTWRIGPLLPPRPPARSTAS